MAQEFCIPPGTYSSTVSQADADAQAQAAAQQLADQQCPGMVFYNTQQCVDCPDHSQTFCIAAGTYSSVISQSDADLQAHNAAQAQADLNCPAVFTSNRCVVCVTDSTINVCASGISSVSQEQADANAFAAAQTSGLVNCPHGSCSALPFNNQFYSGTIATIVTPLVIPFVPPSGVNISFNVQSNNADIKIEILDTDGTTVLISDLFGIGFAQGGVGDQNAYAVNYTFPNSLTYFIRLTSDTDGGIYTMNVAAGANSPTAFPVEQTVPNTQRFCIHVPNADPTLARVMSINGFDPGQDAFLTVISAQTGEILANVQIESDRVSGQTSTAGWFFYAATDPAGPAVWVQTFASDGSGNWRRCNPVSGAIIESIAFSAANARTYYGIFNPTDNCVYGVPTWPSSLINVFSIASRTFLPPVGLGASVGSVYKPSFGYNPDNQSVYVSIGFGDGGKFKVIPTSHVVSTVNFSDTTLGFGFHNGPMLYKDGFFYGVAEKQSSNYYHWTKINVTTGVVTSYFQYNANQTDFAAWNDMTQTVDVINVVSLGNRINAYILRLKIDGSISQQTIVYHGSTAPEFPDHAAIVYSPEMCRTLIFPITQVIIA